MKYLIVGLGNIGAEYENTRHNIGFMVLDQLAKETEAKFEVDRYAFRAEVKYKGRTLILIKPTTFMNLSGKAVRYWMETEKIPIENCLVVVDDLALDVGVLRMKSSGSAGGHNGLTHIEEILKTKQYPRLRFGIGANFAKGFQIEYVLNKFSKQENEIVLPKIEMACEMIKSFSCVGVAMTMNAFNNK
ncbi:MAG: aminoacyl-tRNA hydrolase [Bacteroidales bacterium]